MQIHMCLLINWELQMAVNCFRQSSIVKTMLALFLLGHGPVELSSTNKPLAMRVVEDALAYSKKPPVI